MGGSSGASFHAGALDRLRRSQRSDEDGAVAAFGGELSSFLGDLLSDFNRRDVKLVARRLEEAKKALGHELDGAFDTLFGGSVAKHTYVDGLSDIDCLAIVNDSDLEGKPPRLVLDRMCRVLRKRLADVTVTAGTIALTLEHADGMSIQIVPAERDGSSRLRVPSWRSDEWSGIEPEGFLAALTRRNAECGAKLVPTIKLAKAAIAELPASQRIGGYHVESLAIEAFRGYDGEKVTSAMLPAFFERVRTLVVNPMRDSTGQSFHVDHELGPRNSLNAKAFPCISAGSRSGCAWRRRGARSSSGAASSG